MSSEENLKAPIEVTTKGLENVLSQEEVKEVDRAFMLGLETEGLVLDPAKEKKLVRKIDFYILPMMCILMSCQLMDKSTNSYASIIGLRTDLEMTSKEYSWVGSSFYLGYVFFEYPANILLQKFPISKVLSCAIVAWGVVICCHGACHSAVTFLLCRVLLGMLESFMDPTYMIMTSQWYKKEEMYIRCGVWLGFQGFGTMLGSGIAYGFYQHLDAYSLAPWRLLYIVTGVITITFGLISFVHIPDIPVKAWFLNDEEKLYAVERIRKNRTGFGNPTYKPSQLKEAFTDITTYLYFFFMFGYGIPNGGIGNFGSILLKEQFGFTTGSALLMNMVGSGIDIVFPVAFAYLDRYFIRSRLITGCGINCSIFIGLCLLAFAEPKAAKIIGYYLTYLTTASWACMSSVVSSNVAGHTKKLAANTCFLIGFAAGNIIGPQSFLGSEAPVYITAKRTMVGCYVISAIVPAILYFIYTRRNKKKDSLQAEINALVAEDEQDIKTFFGDLTDKENPNFRYML
ncbi:unnamed protein product [Kuraishia capsulata CBS 1993]|uniref:Major facilitator superfamily (MFS) profile domain-containing protein n=1 Tax=Kuraishia capsulata CBS 1993 TaxID=1382522 RepID=W6MNY9_9ASCO|nr:uncharacterized protein KUCA_T00003968001 [Kuraishia capsulata CBS 1993]CDK27988.1 unnamed protein product [Kuraishia capsulata CBS 1993]